MASAKQSQRPVTWPFDSRDGVPSTECEETAQDPRPALNRELWTRDLNIVGLILGWGASLATLSTGAYIIASGRVGIPYFLFARVALVGPMGYSWKKPTSGYLYDHRVYGVSEAAMVIIPLLLQTTITCIFACLDSIHSTTLRWALWREGRLRHNTNIRLFTSSRQSGPNSWPANLALAVSLVLAYGGATIMTFPVTVIATLDLEKLSDPDADPVNRQADVGPDKYAIDFNGWGLLGLGVGLLIQVAVCTWCLVHESARYVETRNANPLATARACHHYLHHMDNTGPVRSATVLKPVSKQASMGELVPTARTLTNWIWGVFALYAILTVVVAIFAARLQESASLEFVRTYPADLDFAGVWTFFGQVAFGYSNNSFTQRREWAGLLIQCVGLSTLPFGLHLAEVIGIRSWSGFVIFVYKSLVPWVFGYGFACITRVFMRIFPLLTIALLFLSLALLAEYLIRRHPNGSQPATYGDVQALVAFVDDWDHDRLFWGDKGALEGHTEVSVRVAGTSGHQLADLRPGVLYKGLDKGMDPSGK